MADVKVAAQALHWIAEVFKKHAIPFHITGGLAGIVYGSPRTLNDIDIEIPEERISEILPDVQGFIQFGPERYRDENWDLLLLTLNYHGQSIDISGAYTAYIFDADRKQWVALPCHLEAAREHQLFGLMVPVVDPDDYIRYKRSLNRIIQGESIDAIDADATERFMRSQ